MTPVRVVARLEGAIVLPSGALALDGILAAAVAIRDNLPPPTVSLATTGALVRIEIPVAYEPSGRFHLASWARPTFDHHETRYRNRRFPIVEATHFSTLKRIDTNAGPEKSYRIPHSSSHVEGDMLEWWCIGAADEVRALLSLVHGVGKHRNVGRGRVREWRVEPCEPWGEGFPVVRDGRPLRPLPMDWPSVTDATPGYSVLSYPYWERTREEPCLT